MWWDHIHLNLKQKVNAAEITTVANYDSWLIMEGSADKIARLVNSGS